MDNEPTQHPDSRYFRLLQASLQMFESSRVAIRANFDQSFF